MIFFSVTGSVDIYGGGTTAAVGEDTSILTTRSLCVVSNFIDFCEHRVKYGSNLHCRFSKFFQHVSVEIDSIQEDLKAKM